MKYIIGKLTVILIIFSFFTGCTLFGDEDGESVAGNEPKRFTTDDLSIPDANIVWTYQHKYKKPEANDTAHKTEFKYETLWAFQYNIVYARLGGVMQLWLTNLGETQMFVYKFGIKPDWVENNITTQADVLLKPNEKSSIGLISFPGPDLAGNYTYQLKFGIMSRENKTSQWTDWGLTGNKTYDLTVLPLSSVDPSGKYSTRSNQKNMYDQVNNIIDPLQKDIRSQAVLLAKKYEGPFNVYQLCEIFEFVKTNVSYVSDPKGDTNYWSPPEETLELGAGDCEDQATLFSAMILSIDGTARVVMTDTHAFALVYIGSTAAERDSILSAIDSYYNTELRYAWFNDDLGFWLLVDTISSMHPGGLPLGIEPIEQSNQGKHKITGENFNDLSWDYFGTENLYIVDVL